MMQPWSQVWFSGMLLTSHTSLEQIPAESDNWSDFVCSPDKTRPQQSMSYSQTLFTIVECVSFKVQKSEAAEPANLS